MGAQQLTMRIYRGISPRGRLRLLLGAASAVLFLVIADEVLEGEATPADRAISVWVHRHDSPHLSSLMRWLTALGSGVGISLAVLCCAVVALRRRAYAAVALLIGVPSLAALANGLMKMWFQRDRPNLFLGIPLPSSYSFPSGHAMVSTAAYGMIGFVVAKSQPRLRWPLAICAPLLVMLIGLSRVYLGVHWPSDVLAGFAAGGCILSAGASALSLETQSQHRGDGDARTRVPS